MTEKSKRTWFDYWQSGNHIAMIFGVGYVNSIVGPSLRDLAEIYSSTPENVAVMNTARAFGMVVGSFAGDFFYKHVNDQILFMLTLALYAAATSAIPFLPDTTYLYTISLIAGICIGISSIGSQVRLIRIWAEKSASAIQAFHTSFVIGATIAPFACAPFLSLKEDELTVKETQIHIPYAFFGVIMLLVLASMIATYCIDSSGIDDAKEQDQHFNDTSRRGLEILLMVILFIYIFVCMSEEIAIGTLVSSYAMRRPGLHFSKPTAAYLAGVFWAATTVGLIIATFASISVGTKEQLVVSHVLSVIASGILILFGSSAACVWFGVGLLGLGLAAMYGAAAGLVFQYFHVHHIHASVLLSACCAGMAAASYFVPAIVEAEPVFLEYYLGIDNVLHILVLVVLFLAVRGKQTTHAGKEPSGEAAIQ